MWCWFGGRGILKNSLCTTVLCIIMVHNGMSLIVIEQFLQVAWLDRAFILLGLSWVTSTIYLPSDSVSSIFMVLYIYIYIYLDNFFVMAHSLLHLLVSWAWWDCLSTWLTDRRPSVLWHCWLGHLTHKVLRKMTYNVSSGTLNPTMLILIQSFVDIVVPAEWKQNGWSEWMTVKIEKDGNWHLRLVSFSTVMRWQCHLTDI